MYSKEMSQKYILVRNLSTTNNIISQTFQTTYRIKFTCFDICNKYIIFGANSGGIYIFQRDPCKFLKLIPSKEGSILMISISKNGKNLAVANTRGLLIILEDFCNDTNLKYQFYLDHEGETITTLIWNGDDVFCGDRTGKVSVITLMNFLTKAIFQTPSASLMHLGSSIIQLDAFSNYLLVSTQTRTYLCDTSKEHYKQIGKKSRDGPFGACFYNIPKFEESVDIIPMTGNVFKTMEDDEYFCSPTSDNIKIYCARPGARLWEANFQGSVVFTLQFRTCLNQKQSDLIHLDDSDSKLKISIAPDNQYPENFNFRKIFVVRDKLILTFNDDSVFIFNPMNGSLMHWWVSKNIRDLKILNSCLYIWRNDVEIDIISLLTIEEVLMTTLMQKQYKLCGELCIHFSKDIIDLLETSKKIHLIVILKTKLAEYANCNLFKELLPIISKIEEHSQRETLFKPLTDGIVTVHNGFLDYLPESVEHINSNLEINCKINENTTIDILYQQYKLNKIHKNVETTNLNNILKTINLDKLLNIIRDFMQYMINTENDNCSNWCQELYLKECCKYGTIDGFNGDCMEFLLESFLEINDCQQMACTCSYPLPLANCKRPKYFDLGCKLMEKVDCCKITSKIPYMYKYQLTTNEDINLSLLIQYSDPEIITEKIPKLTYDIWDEAIRLLTKLKSGICLNCDRKIITTGTITWKTFGLLMVRSIHSTNALKLIEQYSSFIPKGELDAHFYQYCIYSSTLHDGQTQSLVLCNKFFSNERTTIQLEQSIGKFLQKQFFKNGSPSFSSKVEWKCPYCELPLNSPIIDDLKKLYCGHIHHNLCYIYNKNKCSICDTVLQ